MTIRYALCILFFITSCQSREPENPLVGRWEYERIELNNGDALDLSDSAYRKLHNQHLGLTFVFTEDKTFRVTQKRSNGTEDFIAEQPYELPDSLKVLRLVNTGREHDNFDILGLNDSLFRINVFRSDFGYVVFRKKE